MKKLTMYSVSLADELLWPEQGDIPTLDTSAIHFFTDFSQVQPHVIDSSASAIDARSVMLRTHIRLMFVINEFSQFVGIISADDLAERKIVQHVADGYNRDDIELTDLMTCKKQLKALDIAEVERVSIADVIDVLKDSHQQHCLVIDKKSHRVRGIFSASDISRTLNLPIDIESKADFYKVFAATS